MLVNRILVPLDGSEAGQAALATALAAARRFDGHIDALHVRADPREAIPYMTGGISSGMIEMVMADAGKIANERAVKARAAFDAFCTENGLEIIEAPPPPHNVSAAWLEEMGREAELVVRHGRLADLIVVARPTQDTPAPVILEAALMDCGRPVLIAPPEPMEKLDSHAVVGWNASAEATRAVAAGMPFLLAAEAVTVLATVEHGKPAAEPGDLVEYLAWHGIAADARTVDPNGRTTGEALLAEAATLGADLMIVGGYGHGRMRQLVLGGVTRHLLGAAEIPVFMVH
jgi:nucleotide-binding universal stress UspA family protein